MDRTPATGGLWVETTDGDAALSEAAADGSRRRLATWSYEPLEEDGALEVLRSPSGRRIGVRIGDATWTFAATDGALLHHAPAGPPRPPAADDWGADVVVWTASETARVHVSLPGEPLDAFVAPGVRVRVDGPVDEMWEATDHSGGMQLLFDRDTSDAERRAVVAAARAEQAAAVEERVAQGVTVRFGDRDVTVGSDAATRSGGFELLHWPPLPGPRGLLVRRSRVTCEATVDGPSVMSTSSEVQHPWLFAPDGTVRTLPFQLGNRVLTALPDGRWLLPCWAPMWWDGGDEGLTALDDEGDVEHLTLDGEHLRPLALLRALAPDVAPTEDPDPYDPDWDFTSASVVDGVLTVAVEYGRGWAEPGTPWLLAAMDLDGTVCGPPRRLAHGRPGPASTVRVVV